MSDLAEAWLTLVEEGKAERVGDHDFLPLVTLDSGMRFGLAGELVWARCKCVELTLFGPDTVRAFVEVMEHPRRDFEDRIERAAEAVGLPGLETAWSFPALTLVRTMFAEETAHFIRLALLWLLPTELREMRPDIVAQRNREELPQSLRDLADHLCVREA